MIIKKNNYFTKKELASRVENSHKIHMNTDGWLSTATILISQKYLWQGLPIVDLCVSDYFQCVGVIFKGLSHFPRSVGEFYYPAQ